MDRTVIAAATFAMPLAGCVTAASPAAPPQVPPSAQICDAAPAQEHLGHKASAEAGAVLLRITGARSLRWVPPRTAVTMDYRPDRLTVSYDDDMTIERISCG